MATMSAIEKVNIEMIRKGRVWEISITPTPRAPHSPKPKKDGVLFEILVPFKSCYRVE